MLIIAVKNDNIQLVNILIDKCDIYHKNKFNMTALDYAINFGNTKIIQKLQD